MRTGVEFPWESSQNPTPMIRSGRLCLLPSPPPNSGGVGPGASGGAAPQASPSPRPAGPSADDILNKYIEAIGGQAAIDKLIVELGSDQFAVRQKASAALLQYDQRLLPLIDKALAAAPPLETKTRLETLRNKLSSTVLSNEMLRQARAIEALERIGSAEDRAALVKFLEKTTKTP